MDSKMNLPLRPYQYQPQSWEVGVDLGSTFSAAAYCLTSASTDRCTAGIVQPVVGYKRTQGDKTYSLARYEVPTKVRYEDGGRHVRWGWDVVSFMDRGMDRTIPGHVVELFKPGLDDHASTRDARRQIDETLAGLPFAKSVDQVVLDFLTKLLQHIKTRLQTVGYQDDDNVHLTCTVPAMWSMRAKRRTIKAVEKAKEASGFAFGKSVSLCLEPEAATAYVFHRFENIQLKEGDTFIVCDAGGVTMDVVTYVTMRLNPMCLKEVVRGKGAFCGSSSLNHRFKEQVEERLKEETYLSSIPNSKPVEKLIQAVVTEFELNIKRDFTGTEVGEGGEGMEDGGDLPYTWVAIPGLRKNQEKGFASGDMAVTRAHVEAIFSPVLEDGWDLVQSQIIGAYQQKREPTRLLLVGGFGGSNRLERHMVERCNALTAQLQRRPITVLVPNTPGNAIAEGSIYRFLNKNMVEDHVSRSSICITQHDPLDGRQKAHKGAQYDFDDLEGRNYVHNCVKILLKTDQMVPSTGITKTVHLHRTIAANEENLELTVPIYVLDDGNGTNDYPLSHPTNQGYELLEIVTFKVDVVPIRDKLKRMRYGTSIPCEQPIQSQRRSIRTRKGNQSNGKRDQSSSRSSPSPQNGTEHLHCPLPPSSSESSLLPDRAQDPASYYFWVDYQLEVEFKDGLMTYHLVIKNVNRSFKGQVNLASILEPWSPEDD